MKQRKYETTKVRKSECVKQQKYETAKQRESDAEQRDCEGTKLRNSERAMRKYERAMRNCESMKLRNNESAKLRKGDAKKRDFKQRNSQSARWLIRTPYIRHERDKKLLFFNLKSSFRMFYLAPSASFEYLWYESQ